MGKFSHSSADVLDVAVEGAAKPIGVTAAHRFWSEDRQDFVPAGQLRVGETLRTSEGGRRQVVSLASRGATLPVYNLRGFRRACLLRIGPAAASA